MINDQFLLLCHLMYLVPAVLEQSYLSKNGTNGPFPNLMNWSLLSGWYVTSFTLAYVAVTRLFVIVLHQPNMSRSLAVLSMFFIFLLSWIMSYIAQFEFLCCELIFNPFNYGYGYVSNGNLTNYSNQYFDFPLNNAVSVITVGCYMVVRHQIFQTALPSHGVYSTNTHCSTNPNNSTVNKINSFTKEP
ncbi:unnamed protein product, partial [Mesorhabditis belari]|uniref:7TM GPCR serpentine receptor class x (Srx) domain-containing protein n=1 Tax=Mesorhabditis belari TaxID=2138241 RepID=A0AAF3FHF8_9BILA